MSTKYLEFGREKRDFFLKKKKKKGTWTKKGGLKVAFYLTRTLLLPACPLVQYTLQLCLSLVLCTATASACLPHHSFLASTKNEREDSRRAANVCVRGIGNPFKRRAEANVRAGGS